MRKGILRRNYREDRRQEAKNRLFQIIEETLSGKSDEEKEDIIHEFNEYLKDGGLNKYLNSVTRTNTKVRFNPGPGKNRRRPTRRNGMSKTQGNNNTRTLNRNRPPGRVGNNMHNTSLNGNNNTRSLNRNRPPGSSF